MQKVAVVGAGGRMGQDVCRAVSDAEDLELVAAVDPNHVGEHAAGGSGGSDVIIGATSAVLRALGAEVVVDFSVAEAARDNLAFYAVAEAFLARQLGGRYEPIGNDFVGSTIISPSGTEGVPGLAMALKKHALENPTDRRP